MRRICPRAALTALVFTLGIAANAGAALTGITGLGQPHGNAQPSLGINYVMQLGGANSGDIRMFAGSYAPGGWVIPQGQLASIAQNPTLYGKLGTTYGGDGQSTFALPDLRGRIPLHFGNGFTLAETGGVETVTLTVQQIPSHSHAALATNNLGNIGSPTNKVLAGGSTVSTSPYGTDAPLAALHPSTIGSTGGSQPHNNFQPYLCVDFIISLFGVFPSQT